MNNTEFSDTLILIVSPFEYPSDNCAKSSYIYCPFILEFIVPFPPFVMFSIVIRILFCNTSSIVIVPYIIYGSKGGILPTSWFINM